MIKSAAGMPHSSSSSVTVPDVVRTLLRARWLVAAITLLGIAAFGTFAFLSTPIYRASTVLLPISTDRGFGALSAALGQFGGLMSLAGLNLDAKGEGTEEALAVLRSREFLERFIRDHNLLPRLFPSLWDQSAQRWKDPENNPTPAKAVKYFKRRVLLANKDKKTGLVSVTVDWRDRTEAAAWANELVRRVNEEMRTRAVATAAAYLAYLEKEREATQLVETRDAINRLIESQIHQRMIASVSQDYAFRVVDKALPPDADDILRPRRVRLTAMGAAGGLLLGCAIVLLHASFTGRLTQRPSTDRGA